MTFVPLLASYLLRPGGRPEPAIEERRSRGLTGFYYRLGRHPVEHRWLVTGASVVALMVAGFLLFTNLKREFFPKELTQLSYVDVWLPEDATLAATSAAARLAEEVIRDV